MKFTWAMPGLLETGTVNGQIMVIRDGPVNFFVVKGPAGLVCVDAGWRRRAVERGIGKMNIDLGEIAAVFLTHLHWDHARCGGIYPHARVFCGMAAGSGGGLGAKAKSEAGGRTRMSDGEIVSIAGLPVRAIATPGHTPDSTSYVIDGRFLFTGDALRLRRGRVAAPCPFMFNLDGEASRSSIHKLARLEGLETLLTAHTGITNDVGKAFEDWRLGGEGAPFDSGVCE